MDFSIGDKVRYLNDVGGGTVVKILDSQLVEINDENGFDIPVLKSELVLVSKGEKPTSSKPKVEAEPMPEIVATTDTDEIEGNDSPNLLFAFVPENGNVLSDNFEVYLINDCNYHFLYTVHGKTANSLSLTDAGVADANTKILLTKATKQELSKLSTFTIQGCYYKRNQTGTIPPVQEDLKFNPVKLSKPGTYKDNDFFNEPAIIISIGVGSMEQAVNEIPEADLKALVSQEKQKRPRLSKKPVKKEDLIKEIDLHIHELVDDEAGLTSGDILDIQVKAFKKAMEEAILDKTKKVVFIHGVGQGVLKMKLRLILDRDYKKYQYQDASFAKYKFGATMVEL